MHVALIHAGAGGVGQLLIQLAKARGARVLATVGSKDKAAIARECGADDVILYRETDFREATLRLTDNRGVDVVYDSIGHDTIHRSIRSLKKRGLCILFGASSGIVRAIEPIELAEAGSIFFARPHLADYMRDASEIHARADDLFGHVLSGQLHVTIDRQWPPAQAAEAHAYLEAGKTRGKLLLQMRSFVALVGTNSQIVWQAGETRIISASITNERNTKRGGLQMRRSAAMITCLLLGLASATLALADEIYPSHPINFVVPWGPGGGADQLARVSGKLMEPELNVSLPVINVPGATGQVGLTKLLTGPADGYTIAVLTGDTFAEFADPNTHFKLDQIIPLGIMIQQPSGFYVKMDSPWKSWDDVVAAAKQQMLRVAVTGFGSPDDMTVNFFRNKGMKLRSVPFAEPGLRYPSVLGGQSDLLYEQAGDVRSFLDGKKIRPVIFFSDHPFALYPDIPYSEKLGYDVKLPQFRAIIAKAGTDKAQVKRLSDALQKIAGEPGFSAYLKQQYADPNSYVSAQDSIAYMDKWLEEATTLRATSNTK